jgi:hypothetical protein
MLIYTVYVAFEISDSHGTSPDSLQTIDSKPAARPLAFLC